MPTYVTREEFEARVGVFEREVEGEKLVTRYILEQTRRNGDDLAAMRVELKGLTEKVDGLESKIGNVDAKLTGLAHSLPTMIAEAVREGFNQSSVKNRHSCCGRFWRRQDRDQQEAQ